nr:MAG TPA: hypothetical protein [Caudoviricetes sp.]
MSKKEKNNIVGVMVAAVFAGFCLGAGLANHCNYHSRDGKGMVTVDTVTVRDTVRITEPRAADSVVTGVIRVPMVLPTEPTVPKAEIKVFEPGRLSEVMDGQADNKGDSKAQETGKFARKDTVWAVVPRTQKRYEDSTYMAWVSGYEPRLDSIEVYQKTVVVTKSVEGRVKNRRFNVGLTGGFGYGVFTRKPDVWVGVGCTWRMF